MEFNDKVKILNKLGTKDLIEKLHDYENALEKAMTEEADFKNLNYGYLSGTGDCAEVKRISAELIAQVPETNSKEKKLTAPQKEAWLLRQRIENKELLEAITRQKDATFNLENCRISIEMSKKRLESVKAIINLRRAQIDFLAGSE